MSVNDRFSSIEISQAPQYTTKRHTTVHPRAPRTTMTAPTTTTTESVPLTFQGFLSDDFENSTYVDDDDSDDSVDVEDSPDHDDDKWSSLPIISPPPKKQVLHSNYANNLFSDILWRNNSDWKKLDGIVTKENEMGSMTKVNVPTVTRRMDDDVDLLESYVSASEQKFTYLPPQNPKRMRVPHENQNVNGEPDAKDLKVQFVLDCDYDDVTPSPNMNRFPSAKPHYIPSNVMEYSPDSPQSVFNIHLISSTRAPSFIQIQSSGYQTQTPQKYTYTARPTAPTPQRIKHPTKRKPTYHPTEASVEATSTKSGAVYYFPEEFDVTPPTTVKSFTVPPATKRPLKTITKKTPIKNIYVDPPMVAAISDTFERFYTFFENALTTKVRVKDKEKGGQRSKSPRRKRGKKRPIRKRSTKVNRLPVTDMTVPIFYASTVHPNYRYTQSNAGQKGQKLTTNIQVTSEYVGKEPSTDRPNHHDSNGGSDYSSSSSDYFAGDDYSSQGDDDIRDDEDEDEEDSVDDEESEGSDYGISLGIGVSENMEAKNRVFFFS